MDEGLNDELFMAAAIRLAERNVGLTAENPSVGAIIVAKDRKTIVGHGVTAFGGRPHAETQALAMAGEMAVGGTAYVTLEPCAHYGKTPPCAEALVEAGIARVVIALMDPDERVSGKGVDILRSAGIVVRTHVLAEQAIDNISAYLSTKIRCRPEVALKMALSSDNGIGLKGRGNVVITNQISHSVSHVLRARYDAIMVGISTVVADNPSLTCRLPGLEGRSPIRIVIDGDLRIPVDSELVKTAKNVPTWIICKNDVQSPKLENLDQKGVRVIKVKENHSVISPPDILARLHDAGISSVLLEGGAKTAKCFLESGLVDRMMLFRSPLVLGENRIDAPEINRYFDNFYKINEAVFENDSYSEWRSQTICLPE